jgi:hypothetical protein
LRVVVFLALRVMVLVLLLLLLEMRLLTGDTNPTGSARG